MDKKPSSDEFFFKDENKKKIKKIWMSYYKEEAYERGEKALEDDNLAGGYNFETDPIEAYEDFAHAMGYEAEYTSSYLTILHFKNEYNYKEKDENDEDIQYNLAEYFGYEPSF